MGIINPTAKGIVMSNTIKVIRASGKIKNYIGVIGVEYQPINGDVEMDISIAAGESSVNDFYVETVMLHNGDQAFLVNSQGKTVDSVRVK